jgi:hypothetical protein
MNERPKLGSEQGGLNVHLWVSAVARWVQPDVNTRPTSSDGKFIATLVRI